jgi:hypothetical protein
MIQTQRLLERRMVVQCQPGQKGREDSISKNKLGMVGHICNTSYKRGGGRRLTTQGQPEQKLETLFQKITRAKNELEEWHK